MLLANFFLAINVRQCFFLCFVEDFFVVCFPYYVRYNLVFFLVNIFFINFDNKLFFSAHIFNKLFFSDFRGDKLFFFIFILAPLPPPPPTKISNGASLNILLFNYVLGHSNLTYYAYQLCLKHSFIIFLDTPCWFTQHQ